MFQVTEFESLLGDPDPIFAGPVSSIECLEVCRIWSRKTFSISWIVCLLTIFDQEIRPCAFRMELLRLFHVFRTEDTMKAYLNETTSRN